MELSSKQNEYSEIIRFRGALSTSCIKPFNNNNNNNKTNIYRGWPQSLEGAFHEGPLFN